jgi:glycosyltransferase involved in cell wall biosynthesis
MWQRIKERLNSQVYDVVHLFGGIQVYEFAELLTDQPTVITPYESYSLYLEREYAHSADDPPLRRMMAWLRLRMAKNFESWMFNRFDQVVVVSKKDARVFRELNPKLRMTVIPNGVDIVRFTPSGEPAHRPILIFTGNFAYKPNYDTALLLVEKIFPAVRKHVPKAHLMLVGIDPPPRLLKIGESEHITVTGRVPDVRVYLDQAAAFVCPMRLGAGIKNKILEAMAMGVPVVATPMSCDGIDVTDGENVLLAEKPSDMVKQIIRLIKSRSLRERVGVAGRELVEEHYTWGCVAAQYEALYRHVREAKLR